MSRPIDPADKPTEHDEELARAIARGLFAAWQIRTIDHPRRFEELAKGVLAGMMAERRGVAQDLGAVLEATA